MYGNREIQVTKDLKTKAHIDANNKGWSYIVGLGNYSGGHTWVARPDGKDNHEVREDIKRHGHTYYSLYAFFGLPD